MGGVREAGRVLMTAEWVVGYEKGAHVLLPRGEVVFADGKILFVGHSFPGEVARRIDCGAALIGPGFIDPLSSSSVRVVRPGCVCCSISNNDVFCSSI